MNNSLLYQKKVMIAAGFLILTLILINTATAVSCLTSGSPNAKKEIISNTEQSLQNIIKNEGINLDVFNDQKNYEEWNLNSDSVKLEIKFIDGITSYHDIFGYYSDSAPSTFVPLFAIKNTSAYPTVPVLSAGEKINLIIKDTDKIKFAINYPDLTNPIYDSVVYESGGKYIIGFEDLIDKDYQDLVVSFKVSC